ncbi:MAG: hypothetical protein D6712_05200 [Chloroflexi bacterium]|nr:MAG: hypothetical protein D6712_05200 [Chloroflexota bacterium]
MRMRPFIITISSFVLLLMLVLFLAPIEPATAQPGGGRRTPAAPGGIQVPTIQVPNVQIPTIEIPAVPTIQVPNIQVTLPALGEDVVIPTLNIESLNLESLMSELESITVPEDLPTYDELMAELESYALPYDLSSLESYEDLLAGLSLESSEEAYQVVVSFAAEQLGRVVSPIYAGSFTTTVDDITTYEDVYAELVSQVMNSLPVEMQTMLEGVSSLPATAYWGIFADGGGVVYVADCAGNPACAVDVDSLQLQLNTASVGTYVNFFSGTLPADDAGRIALLQSVYPALATYQFVPYSVEEATVYFALSTQMEGQTAIVTVVYAGLVQVEDLVMAYAMVGLGDGYVQLMTR